MGGVDDSHSWSW